MATYKFIKCFTPGHGHTRCTWEVDAKDTRQHIQSPFDCRPDQHALQMQIHVKSFALKKKKKRGGQTSYLQQLKGHRDSHVDGWSFIRFSTVAETNVLCKSDLSYSAPTQTEMWQREETLWMNVSKYLTDLGIWCVILAYDIRKQQIPSSDEGQQLSHCHVAVKVRWACFRNPRPKLCIAQPCEYGGDGGDEEGDDNAGSRGVPGHFPRQDIDACPQSAAHTEGHQVQGAQAPVKRGLLAFGIQRLPPGEAPQEGLEQIRRHASGAGSKGGTGGNVVDRIKKRR